MTYYYFTISVFHASEQSCIANSSAPVVTSVGYLANIITDETNQGAPMCPWTIQLQQEETVHLTLLDFATYRNVTSFDRGSTCHIYAMVKDNFMKHDGPGILICGQQTKRVTVVLTTTARVVEISVRKLNYPTRDPIYFLIKYEGRFI